MVGVGGTVGEGEGEVDDRMVAGSGRLAEGGREGGGVEEGDGVCSSVGGGRVWIGRGMLLPRLRDGESMGDETADASTEESGGVAVRKEDDAESAGD